MWWDVLEFLFFVPIRMLNSQVWVTRQERNCLISLPTPAGLQSEFYQVVKGAYPFLSRNGNGVASFPQKSESTFS